MITFLIGVTILVLGYLFYGRLMEKVIGVSAQNTTPAVYINDGVDFAPLPTWKVFVIQFLNIAGLGPIFGAITGAAFGPVAYIWIVFGNILMGAAYDFCTGMLSVRNAGANIPKLVGKYLGKGPRLAMAFLTIFLMIGVVGSFTIGPADLLSALTGWSRMPWLFIVFGYYVIATLLPIDKIIGRVYPLFGFFLIFMALAVCTVMIIKTAGGSLVMPELTLDTFRNFHRNPDSNMIFPMMFIVISCGAMSGFHATQSPLMARCIRSEKYARPVFYGAMVCEGIIALIWANAAIAYLGGADALNEAMAAGATPAVLVDAICRSWLGKVGGIIAIIGVVICPITSGDTAMRGLRITVAEAVRVSQKKFGRRLLVSLPVIAVCFLISLLEFDIVWKYLGILNQTLAMLLLWMVSVALKKSGRCHWVMSIPAVFVTFIVVSYFMIAPHKVGGLELGHTLGFSVAPLVALAAFAFFHFGTTSGRKI